MASLTFRRETKQARYFTEKLGDALGLDMVLVPGGTFTMGSPADEPDRWDHEGPQHEVTVPAFFMGRYPVTQAQWRFVAGLPQVKQSLKPDPSSFKGNNHPVETVTWYDAVEFCARLSAHTQRDYGLPSEAQWEYACRAGTTTPFYFGPILTPEVANFDGNCTYNDSPKGEYRKQTTPVDHFGLANAFGLCDMHGNVEEWCQDHPHNNYQGAPTDGTTWIDEGALEDEEHILRGGSWYGEPVVCRSAHRSYDDPRESASFVGFRVVCITPRAL
ncbi:MAG: formylglycine-generating enzyme family protein [Leptolyngbya sp. LCM1.Bin17]|nr:MAG: formylglycine-generating enzyme family protein [Leptolyngbya sp. LCM1.Bin17]